MRSCKVPHVGSLFGPKREPWSGYSRLPTQRAGAQQTLEIGLRSKNLPIQGGTCSKKERRLAQGLGVKARARRSRRVLGLGNLVERRMEPAVKYHCQSISRPAHVARHPFFSSQELGSCLDPSSGPALRDTAAISHWVIASIPLLHGE